MNRADIHIQNVAGETIYHRLHIAPSTWKEMDREHLILWASALGTELDIDNAKIGLAAYVYKIPAELFKHIPRSEAKRLAKSVDFLFNKNLLNTWLIPSFWQHCLKYYGPKSSLSNITAHEFSLAEHCYEQFGNTKNAEYLETLMAILYRPRRLWGIDTDIRVKLTDYGYIKRAKTFKKLPARLKYAVYLNYEGCRHFLHQKHKDVFTPPEKGKKAGKSLKLTPWPKIIESGANDIFGPMESTKQTNIQEFLSRLGTRIKEQQELDEKFNNNR